MWQMGKTGYPTVDAGMRYVRNHNLSVPLEKGKRG